MVTWQIVSGLGQAHTFRGGSSYPAPFKYFVNVIEFFMLDFFAFFHAECVVHTTYAHKLMVSLVTVVSMGVVAVLAGAAQKCMGGDDIFHSTSVKGYIVLIYIVLPIMSSMAFSAFNCDQVSESGGSTDTFVGGRLPPPLFLLTHPSHAHTSSSSTTAKT